MNEKQYEAATVVRSVYRQLGDANRYSNLLDVIYQGIAEFDGVSDEVLAFPFANPVAGLEYARDLLREVGTKECDWFATLLDALLYEVWLDEHPERTATLGNVSTTEWN